MLAARNALSVSPGLWHRGDRMAILLLGAGLGRPGPALLALLVVLGLDAWLTLERFALPRGFAPEIGPRWSRALRPDGTFVPAVRWTSLAVTAALFLLLPVASHWRF
jgi:hypothetical protein